MMMALFYFIKILYFFSLVSFKCVCCNLYSDPLPSGLPSCDAKDHTCKSEDFHNAGEVGPTFIGRDGLTRLDGIKVSNFKALYQFTIKYCSTDI